MTLNKIKEEIEKAESIVIVTHENPDGDAVGSSLALYHILKKFNDDIDVIIPEYPSTFTFLPGSEIIKKETDRTYDLAISVDCATTKILKDYDKYFENATTKIVIDHHATNTMYGDYNFVNPDAPACAQILLTIQEFFKVDMNQDIGVCIIAGIITDTGGFQYSNVQAETFEFAADLLKDGINISNVYKKVMETKTRVNFEVTKLAMNRMEFLENGKVTFTYITKEDEEKFNAKNGDYDGIVNVGRAIEGVEVSVFVKEKEDGLFKVSLRSNEYVNVSDISLVFGGGGHIHAAGCRVTGNINQVKDKLISQIKLYLK